MHKYLIALAIFALFLANNSFAFDKNDPAFKKCSIIVDACKNAGFNSDDDSNKSFWFGCMKPVLLGQSVKDVNVDAKDVKECRKAKITKMEKELEELKAVK